MSSHPLLSVYQHEAPFVTLFLDTDGAVPQAAQRFATRWKDVLRELPDLGLDADTVTALDVEHEEAPHLEGNGLVMVASGGAVHLIRHLADAPPTELVRVETLPHLLPLIEAARSRPPHLLVLIDREGADILASRGEPGLSPVETVESARHPVHKTGTGGWSALRYEHNVEKSWKASSQEVAERVAAEARRLAPTVIAVAGDERARELMVAALPEEVASRVIPVSGGRSADESEAEVVQEVLAAVRERVSLDTHDLLGRFAGYRGREEKVAAGESVGAQDQAPALKAADGIGETVAALREGRVEALILTDGVPPDASAYFGDDPFALAADASDAAVLGIDPVRRGPLVDVLIRAALAGDADVVTVADIESAAPTEGVGALLRY